jgi:dihydrofolate synthase/folylpolyglutamate synthase
MSLAGTLEKLYVRRRFGIRPGLDRVRLLLERLGHPELAFRSIHVVGTNGKGSTSAFLASILSSAGYRSALFTSPHLVDFSERFRINGHEIAWERLELLLDAVLEKSPPEATFFEIVTALAALCFAEERVDLAVIEAGMGGKSDATATMPGILTVITPISLDHTEYLGTTMDGIAAEKVGIAEPGTPVVSGLQIPEVSAVIRRQCRNGSNSLFSAGHDFHSEWNDKGMLDYHGIHATLMSLVSGIPGRYQAGNAALALAAAEVAASVGLPVSTDALVNGIKLASWPGRMEQVAQHPCIVLDGAHNLAGMAALADSLKDFVYDRLHVVIGCMKDKEIDSMLAIMAPHAACFYAVAPAVDRVMPSSLLARRCRNTGIPSEDGGSVRAGLELALRQSGADDLVVVCGSLFTVGEVKAHLSHRVFSGIRG